MGQAGGLQMFIRRLFRLEVMCHLMILRRVIGAHRTQHHEAVDLSLAGQIDQTLRAFAVNLFGHLRPGAAA